MVAFWIDEESHVRVEVPRGFADGADLCVIGLVLYQSNVRDKDQPSSSLRSTACLDAMVRV